MVTMAPDASSLAEVLDRILDKGVVVDIWPGSAWLVSKF